MSIPSPIPRLNLSAWLVRKSGPLSGARHLIRGPMTRVGRSPENDVVIDDAIVSANHVEIRKEGSSYRICDRNSTNGTFVNGERVAEADLHAPSTIQLGADGPELTFVLDAESSMGFNQTLVARPNLPALGTGSGQQRGEKPASAISGVDEKLLSQAVTRARLARRKGVADQTVVIMREVLGAALHRTGRRFKTVIGILVLALLTISAYGYWKIRDLKREKSSIDKQIQDIESLLEKSGEDSSQTAQLLDRLDKYEDQARALQSSLFYRVGVRENEEFIRHQIRALLAEFGAETYSIPPEFLEEVKRFIENYQGPDRSSMTRALGQARRNMEAMRQIFEEDHLPPDLAYMALVESTLQRNNISPAGAVGMWQFTPATARQYGLRINKSVDERLDVQKSTRAARRYIRELILDFGAGSSVMLAMAAYNLGPTRVKQAVRKISDPIKQRSFWYLYRVRALPAETREYVPKAIAAMIIGRNPERFGF